MDNLKSLYNLVYKKHFKNCIDPNNSIHEDIKNILICSEVHSDKFKEVIKLIGQKANDELEGKVYSSIENGILDDIYFAENQILLDKKSIDEVTEKRQIKNVQLSSNPLTNPFKQIIITSNIMLTLPADYSAFDFDNKHLIDMNEIQENWYDHPIPLDISDHSNEIIYGLTNLNKAVKTETKEIVTVILSVSVTHNSLNKIAKEYIKSKLADKDVSSLDIYIFTEDECNKITQILDKKDKELKDTLGVSGKYGRHYSFLKAITPLFKQVVNNDIKATFKIDLDQVFPQKKLMDTTGRYAFDNFKSPRWGATGVDSDGKKIKLAMAAGGLVNESDIESNLFTPDVKEPEGELTAEQLFFNSSRPQYISTVAEICKQYSDDTECIMRYHVTGGMNGILIADLIKFRPFTPSFFTRAEDQAYLLSVIKKEVDGEYMRCVHLDKFVMRHDKQAFLSDNLNAFEIPKSVGDFERMLIFSHYSYDILKCGDYIKKQLYPFTGCFVLKRPHTALLLRTLARLLRLNEEDGSIFLDSFIPRITTLIHRINSNELNNIYIKEKNAYDRYYDMIASGISKEKKEKIYNVFEQTRFA